MSRSSVGRTVAESRAAQPANPRPPAGAPNVVVVVLDDLGFAQLGCFGSDIATPTIDGLAARGLRFNQFHVTALCSPTRASLLTGQNHHAVGMGFLTDIPMGFPGYDGRIPRSAATLARVLRDAGYATWAVGKWHLAPRWEQTAAGPFERWPLGLGFERYYGFLAGDTNQWTPELVRDNASVAPPRSPAEGYHLTEDLVDEAIRNVRDLRHAAPEKPFFLYLATGAVHAPHQVPPEWIARYRGRFDLGWEAWRERVFARQQELGVVPAGTALTERPPWVDAWRELGADERAVAARLMEVFAGFLEHTDAQLGRLVAYLEREGLLDNTLLCVLSDNGASGEGGPGGLFNEHSFMADRDDEIARSLARLDEIGGPRAYNHYPWGWAWAGNAPFRLWKRFTWLGGVRAPLVVHWPRRIARGGAVRTQFCHAVDLFPTVLAATGVPRPAQVDGVAQRAARRREPARLHRRRRGPRAARDAVLRDGRQPLALPRRLEGDDGPRRQSGPHRAGARRGQPRLRDGSLVAVPPRKRLLGSARPSRRRARASARARGSVVGGGRPQSGAAARGRLPLASGRDGAPAFRFPAHARSSPPAATPSRRTPCRSSSAASRSSRSSRCRPPPARA